ncbi:hypothetical protein B7494_g5299 [Chlorociboria aeruginascens]|nr:hypothetical protein B7494_g5299 [Chlorociboria aeruginascens]
MTFDSIPILDLSLAKDPSTKPDFLTQLRHALLEVGFLYLKNVGISEELTEAVKREAEITAFCIDQREQIDLSTDHALPPPSAPLYRNLFAPTLWPSPSYLPDFKTTFSTYITQMGAISIFFTSLIAEAIGLPSTAFNKYFEEDQQHKLKIVKYPDLKQLGITGEGQGVGPHKDSMLTSYLLQVTEHRGLQVQNLRGDWIDCPPIDGTLVVAIGQGMEALTKGVCMSTTHRVLSPQPGTGARYSIPFFQGVSLDAEFEELNREGVGKIPDDVLAERNRVIEQNGGRADDVEFTFKAGGAKTLGEATLRNRIKSHPDVGERWYPDVLREIREEQAQEKLKKERALPLTPPEDVLV